MPAYTPYYGNYMPNYYQPMQSYQQMNQPMLNQPLNNPMLSMVQMAMGGMSPMQYLQQRMGQNPQIAQAMNLIQGKTPEQLHQIADNMAKQRGTTVEEIARQYGFPINQTTQNK